MRPSTWSRPSTESAICSSWRSHFERRSFHSHWSCERTDETLESQLTKAREFEKAELILTYREGLGKAPTEPAPILATEKPASASTPAANSAVASSSLRLPQWIEKATEKGGKLRIWGTIKGTPIDEAEVLKEMRENDFVRVMTDEHGLIFGMRRNGNGYHIVIDGNNPIRKQVESGKIQALDPRGGSWLADEFA
jgi:hypothetical protein